MKSFVMAGTKIEWLKYRHTSIFWLTLSSAALIPVTKVIACLVSDELYELMEKGGQRQFFLMIWGRFNYMIQFKCILELMVFYKKGFTNCVCSFTLYCLFLLPLRVSATSNLPIDLSQFCKIVKYIASRNYNNFKSILLYIRYFALWSKSFLWGF